MRSLNIAAFKGFFRDGYGGFFRLYSNGDERFLCFYPLPMNLHITLYTSFLESQKETSTYFHTEPQSLHDECF